MQHQPQGGGGGGGGGGVPQSSVVISDEHQKLGDLGIAEAASPISSRPPAAIASHNFEELMRATAEGGGGASSSGNRWPSQETLALIQIRSEMDAVFRDATLKGPIWEQVSRKLGELGYKRSAKKCKEKFENVHKYYKRTKEGRGGRQDGKSYKFFNQLEALHHTATPSSSHNLVQLLPSLPNPTSAALPPLLVPQPEAFIPPRDTTTREEGPSSVHPSFGNVGITFSTDTSSSSEDEKDEAEDVDMEMESADDDQHLGKRKRSGGGCDSDERMMEFFEGLLKQVMQKQESMQQKFLEAIERREQDRMIREEAWKRQDMARIAREHDLMTQERAISASRDAAIIAFLEKITGQTIQLPSTAVPQNPRPPPPVGPQAVESQNDQQNRDQYPIGVPSPQSQQQPPISFEIIQVAQQQPNNNSTTTAGIVAAIPEQQIPLQEFTGGGGSSSLEILSSSRWPKAEVLALIQLRSGMEVKYQEPGPKGPLWEEISAGMQRMGYNRSAKRCKEKWENINKYFKKVKESKKKRPEDAKTCPYFHELDELYRKKIIGSTSGGVIGGVGGVSGSILGSFSESERQQQDVGMVSSHSLQGNKPEDKDGGRTELQTSSLGAYPATTHFGEQSDQGNVGVTKQPEDMLKKNHQQGRGDMMDIGCNNIDGSNYEGLGQDNDDDDDSYEEFDENEEYDDKTEEEMKMAYKIQFQRQNVGSSNGGGTASSTSFMAMVK